MKRINLIFRIALTLMVLASLGVAFAAPVAAQPAPLTVNVNAWTKSDNGTIEALEECIPVESEFLINAAIVQEASNCEPVTACIVIDGPAHLDPCEPQIDPQHGCKDIGNIQACRLADVWWKLHCDAPGSVTILVSAATESGDAVGEGFTVVGQCFEENCPVMMAEIIECPEEDVEVSQVFAVKAIIKSAEGEDACPRSVSDVVATIKIEEGDPAELVPGMPDHWNLGDMDPGDEHEVAWTLHCTDPGDVHITVDIDFAGAQCDEVIPGKCEVHQIVPACLTVDISEPTPDQQICANCEEPFQIKATVCNDCDVPAKSVQVKLTWTADPNTISVPDPKIWFFEEIGPDDCEDVCWDAICKGVGNATFTVTATGVDGIDQTKEVSDADNVSIEQVPFIVEITAPEDCDVFSTEQEFTVSAHVRNCTKPPGNPPPGLTDVQLTISWDPESGATLDGDATKTFDICRCDEADFSWDFECAAPTDNLTFTVTASHSCFGTASDEVTVKQELKAHLVGGLETYFQCPDCEIMEPMTAFVPGQVFHVVVPVCNTGEADAEDVKVGITVQGEGVIVDAEGNEIGSCAEYCLGTIDGNSCDKAFFLVKCTGDGDVGITITKFEGKDENTGECVKTENKCPEECVLVVEQIPVDISFIQPDECEWIAPCTFFAIKAQITNEDEDDVLGNVQAELFFEGNVELAEGQPKIIDLNDLLAGEMSEATWQMHCKDFGEVKFWIVVRSFGPPEEYVLCLKSEERTIYQRVPPTCVEIEITSPDMRSMYATSQEFAVTAVVTNTGCETAYNVVASIEDCPFVEVLSDEEIVIGELAAGECKTVTWTLHCLRSGLTEIEVCVDWENRDDSDCCDSYDKVIVWQYPAAHLEIDITEFPADPIVTSTEYDVIATITNTGEADATEVYATLSVQPEGSVRVAAGDSGYTKFIGTIPGHNSDNNSATVTWRLHCKVPCDSTITITATGADEYGWHMKQQCASTGLFKVEGGLFVSEELDTPDDVNTKGWTAGLFFGDANGLIGPFSVDTPVSFARLGGGPDYTGRLVAMGTVLPAARWCDVPEMFQDDGPCDGWLDGNDMLFFIGHLVMDTPCDEIGPYQFNLAGPGMFQVINGQITGLQFTLTGQTGVWIISFLGGTYCSNMAAEAGRAIQDRFIEPDSVTVKQLPSTADLSICKDAFLDSGAPCTDFMVGDLVKFGIVVLNEGPSPAIKIKVSDVLPAGLNFVSGTTTQGYYDVMSGVWNVGDLGVSMSATLCIRAIACVPGQICNTATIVASEPHDPVTTGNSSSKCISVQAAPPVEEVCLPLKEGYNLISLPLIPENPAIASMLSGVDYDQVAQYEAKDPLPGIWRSYPGGLTEIKDGWGYWIKMDCDDSLCFEGYELAIPPPSMELPPSYKVVEGWNLIGFKSTMPKLPAQYLAGIAGKYVMIYGFKNGAYFIAGAPGHVYLEPGLGYWIAIIESGTIYP